jgi:hypothetical protein
MQPIDHIKASFSHPDDILNYALELHLEWGENFGKPIHDRMKQKYPHLWPQEIDQLDSLAKAIKYDSFRLFEQERDKEILEYEVQRRIKEQFPGISQDNINSLTVQGMYYARR